MDDENPPPNRPYRIRRQSASLISSTTSPMFSAPPTPTLQPPPSPMAHHSRHRPNNNNNTNSNNNNGAISQQNNNFGPGDIDDDVQPSSSSSPFPPPSPRPARIGASSSASFSRNSAQSIQGPQSPLSSPDSTFWGGAAPSPSPVTPSYRNPSTPGGMCVVSSSTIDDVPPSPFSPAEDNLSNHSVGGGGGGGSSNNNSGSGSNNNFLNNPLLAGPVQGPSHSNNVNLNSANNSGGNIVANNSGSLLVHNRISQLIVASGMAGGGGGPSSASASSNNHQQHPALISQLNQDNSIENHNNSQSQSHQNHPSGSSPSSGPSNSSTSSSSSSSSSFAFSSSMSPLRNKIKKASSFERFSQQAQAASSGGGSGGAGSSSSSNSTSSNSSRATGGNAVPVPAVGSPAIVQNDNSIPTGLASRGGGNEIISNNSNNNNDSSNEHGGGGVNEQPISSLPQAAPQPPQSAIVSRLNSNWEPVASNAGPASTSSSSSSFRLSQNVHFGSDKSHIKIPSKKLAAKIASVFEQEQLNEAAAIAAAAAAAGTNVIIPSTSTSSSSSSSASFSHHHQQQQQQQQQQQSSMVQSYLSSNSPTSSPPQQSQNSSSNNANNSTLSQILNEGPVHHLTGIGNLVSAAEDQIMSNNQQQQQHSHSSQGIHSSVAVTSHENLIRELSESPLNLAESSSNNNNNSNSSSSNSNSNNNSHHHHHSSSHLHHSHQSQPILPQRNPVISSSRASSLSTTSNHTSSASTSTSYSSSSSSTSTLLSKKIPLTPKQKLLHRIQSGIISPPPPPPPQPQPAQLQQQQQSPPQQHHQLQQHVLSLEHQMQQDTSPSPPQQQQQTVQQLSQQLQQASLSTALSMQTSSANLQSTNLSLEQLSSGTSGSNANHLILPHSPNAQLDAYSYEALLRAREDLVVQEALGKIIEDPSNVNNMPYDTPEAYAYYQSILSDDEIFTGNAQQQSSRSAMQQQIQGGLQISNESLQQQQQQAQQQHPGGQIEFVLGLPGGEDHDRGSARADDLSLGGSDGGAGQQQQFLDSNDALVAMKSHNQSQADSTLRNLLMMDSSRGGHITTTEESWLLAAEYQNRMMPTDFNSRSSSTTTTTSIRNGMIGSGANTGLNSSSVLTINGLPTSIGATSWSNDASWQRTSIAWQHQGGMPVDQDEVMDMSMIEPDKGNNSSGSGQQSNSIVFSKRMSQLHAYGDQGSGMDEVNLQSDRDLSGGLPLLQNMSMSMPMDLQQPLGLMQSTSNITTSLKNVLINSANGLPIDLQQHHKILSATTAGSAIDMDDQPVNLIAAVNLEHELGHHSNVASAHHHQQQQQQHSAAHLLPHHLAEVKTLGHSSSGGNSSNDHSGQNPGGSYTLQIHQQQIPNEFQHHSQQQHLVEVNNLSPILDNIDERRIIRVKKNKDNIPFGQEDTGNGLPPPNFIPDKPVQLKSHATLPSPLQLIKVGNGDDDWAVFTRNKAIPPNTRFGPVEGSLKKACAADMDTMNALYPSLIVTDHHNNVLWKVNREDDDCCNWMKFVRMAHSIKDQNALVSECDNDGHLYFTTCKEIPPRTELQVGFSFEYAQKYGLPYLLPMPNANSPPNNNLQHTPAPSSPPPTGMLEDGKITISSLQQQNALGGTSSVIHGSQNYLHQQQLQKCMNEDNDQVIVQNHQHQQHQQQPHTHHSHPSQHTSSVSPETTSSVLSQQPQHPPPVTQQKSVIVESYQCFECEQEFPDVAQLQDHLEKMHKEPEPEIRRPKKKAIKKYQQQQLQQQNSAVSTTNNQGNGAGTGSSTEAMDISFPFESNSNLSNKHQQQSGKVDSSSQINAVDSSDLLSLNNLPMTKKRKAASSMNAMKALTASSSSSITSENQNANVADHSILSDNSAQSSVLQRCDDVKEESVVSSGDSGIKSGSDKDYMIPNNYSEIDSMGGGHDEGGVGQHMQVDGNSSSGGGGGTANDNDVTASQPPAKVKCTMCYKSFATKERLDKHMIVHSDEDTKPLKCPFCPKRFLTNSALAGHIKTHAEEGKCFECPICTFSTQQLLQLKEHVQTHKNRDSGMFHCPQCPKKFSAYSMIRKHIRAFHGPRQYECEQCPMSFPTSDKLKLHKLKHSDHREFLCAECGRQFKRKDKLREHTKRIHETKRKVLELTLPKDKSIKKFLPKISPEEYERFVYKCSECMVGFKRRGMLVNHLAKRHPEKPPQQVPELNMPIVRPARNYFCLYCERVYKSSSKRKAHIIKAHPGKPVPPQARSKDIPQQLASFIDPQPLQPGTIVQTLTDDGNNTARAGVVTSSRLTGGVVSTSTLAAARREAVVGKVVAQPHGCQWCHRQYATRAKLLQHQRKAHIHLMPPDMQTPRTQKNNVAKKEESPKKSKSAKKSAEQDSVITSNVPSIKPEVPSIKVESSSKTSSKLASSTKNSSNNAVSTTSVLVSSQSGSSNNNLPSSSSTPGGTTAAAATTLQTLQAEGLPIQTEDGGVVGILVTNVGSNVELGNLVQGDVPIVMLTTQPVGSNSTAATQAALSALQGVNFSVLQAGQVTNHGNNNASSNNIISLSPSSSPTNNVENNAGGTGSNNNTSSSGSSSNNNHNNNSSSSTVTSRIANVIQHHQSSSGVISTTGKL